MGIGSSGEIILLIWWNSCICVVFECYIKLILWNFCFFVGKFLRFVCLRIDWFIVSLGKKV